jgi:hypothetical protein
MCFGQRHFDAANGATEPRDTWSASMRP